MPKHVIKMGTFLSNPYKHISFNSKSCLDCQGNALIPYFMHDEATIEEEVGRPFTLGAGTAVAPLRHHQTLQAGDSWRQDLKSNVVPESKHLMATLRKLSSLKRTLDIILVQPLHFTDEKLRFKDSKSLEENKLGLLPPG